MTRLDKGYWASQLGVLIEGKAQVAYLALPQDEARLYDWAKATILYRLKINPEHYWKLFQAKKGQEERQPWILLQLLQDLLNKWINPVVYDQDALADQILLEQFQNDLEEWTQCWVCQHSPGTYEEAMKLAEAFTASEVGYS